MRCQSAQVINKDHANGNRFLKRAVSPPFVVIPELGRPVHYRPSFLFSYFFEVLNVFMLFFNVIVWDLSRLSAKVPPCNVARIKLHTKREKKKKKKRQVSTLKFAQFA